MCKFFKRLYYSKHPERCKCYETSKKLEVVERPIGKNKVYDIYGVVKCCLCGNVVSKQRIVKDISVKRPEELENAMTVAKRDWLEA